MDHAARVHGAFDREAGPVEAALEAIPRGARVMPLVFENRGHVLETWPYLHFGQYGMVGGVGGSEEQDIGVDTFDQ